MAGRGDIPPFRTSSPFGGSEQMERISLERGQERRLDGGPSFNVGLTGREIVLGHTPEFSGRSPIEVHSSQSRSMLGQV
ncbi:hypothetical protein PDE_06212 [Penicillium oxalicum 114-2]|uniref:Uncharacterized protein n=1 Tax=Penicillium oxalicum (strain 114-2 / CGMCC 5302) TaxID=933388 RepID=S8B921_PENO1|nr:hypothetical protein PDE_06212 [Penicillium oxalicum 114-2]